MKRPWIIKAGGELMGSPAIQKKIVADLKRLSRSHPIVFVHGGGPQIEQDLVKNKIPVRFVNGRRFTSDAGMIVIEKVLSGHVNKDIVGTLASLGVKAVGLSCRDGGLVVAKPLPKLGRAAKPVRVDPSLLTVLLNGRFLPVVSTVGADDKGKPVNINADDAASAIAIRMKAEHLVFLTNIQGVKDQNKKTIRRLKIGAIEKLISSFVITGGMIPKVQSAKSAVLKGVGEVNIIDGSRGVRLDAGTAILR
jgi:acetylglutamate kinase